MQATAESRTRSRLTTFLVFAAWGTLVAPATIVLHELGHLLAGLGLGTPDIALHYGSVSDSAAESGFPAFRVGLQALAGPVVTLLLMAACMVALRKHPDHPLFFTALFAAPIRFAVGAVYLYFAASAALQGIAPGQPNFDEFNAAQMLGFPVVPLLIAELAVTFALWTWAVRRLASAIRLPALTGTLIAIVTGIGVWIGGLGPLLLP
jgi:hypothetical protein